MSAVVGSQAIISLVELAAEAALRAYNDYQKARELAAQAGISEADLATSDARFAKAYIGAPPAVVPPGV